MEKNKQKFDSLKIKVEEIYSLHKSWKWLRANDVCSKINDGTHFSPPNNSKGDIPYVTAKNIRPDKIDLSNITYIDKKIHRKIFARCNPEKGDVLYTKDGTVGYSAVNNLDFEFSLLSSVALLKPHKSIIIPHYLSHYLNSPVNFYRTTGKMTGTALRRIILKTIKEIPIPLAPINEQKRIVLKIEELFLKVDHITDILCDLNKKIEFLRISLIRWIFFGDFKNKNYSLSNWKTGEIVDFFNIVGGGTPSTKNQEYWKGKIPWITSADIYGIRDIRPRRTVSKLGIENSATHIIPKNSILVVTRVGLGKLAILDTPTCINQDIQGLIPKVDNILSSYALHYLSETIQIFKFQNRGTTIAGVTKKQLAELPFVLAPINEQIEITNFIDSQLSFLTTLKEQVELLSSFTKHLKLVILKQAFEGKLVPQDPNDEPASELLKRIKSFKTRT